MKETIFMRVLFCKIHRPFMCFCKPSAAHIYTSGPLKLENTPHNIEIVPSAAYAVSAAVCNNSSSEVKEESANGKHETYTVLKSCIKKVPCRPDSTEEVGKKRVRWMDEIGKELAEIKEFESSDGGDTDNEEEPSRCLCVIL